MVSEVPSDLGVVKLILLQVPVECIAEMVDRIRGKIDDFLDQDPETFTASFPSEIVKDGGWHDLVLLQMNKEMLQLQCKLVTSKHERRC